MSLLNLHMYMYSVQLFIHNCIIRMAVKNIFVGIFAVFRSTFVKDCMQEENTTLQLRWKEHLKYVQLYTLSQCTPVPGILIARF